MIPLSSGTRIFLRPARTDGRWGINSLTLWVQEVLQETPFSGHLFLFLIIWGTTLKALYWDRNGFCLWQKRLEEYRVPWPKGNEEKRDLSAKELQWLLDGLDISRLKTHRPKVYQSVL